MDEWKYDSAHDLGLSEAQRLRSLRRESGLIGLIMRNVWWWTMRGYFASFQRVRIEGRANLPSAAPFILVANHASHLDALVLACTLPLRQRNRVFPIAAGDTFFETPAITALAAGMMNALPLWRKNAGRHAMAELRQRLVAEPCGYILFPEGTRTRTGEMGPFRAGIGDAQRGVGRAGGALSHCRDLGGLAGAAPLAAAGADTPAHRLGRVVRGGGPRPGGLGGNRADAGSGGAGAGGGALTISHCVLDPPPAG